MRTNKQYTDNCHKDFGNFIKTARETKGYYQHEAAELIGVSQPYYSRLEQGLRDIDLALALKICKALKIDLDEFVSKYNY